MVPTAPQIMSDSSSLLALSFLIDVFDYRDIGIQDVASELKRDLLLNMNLVCSNIFLSRMSDSSIIDI